MPGSDPIPPKVFAFDGVRYTFSPAEFNERQPFVMLPDGRLLKAAGFDDGVPFNLAVVPYAQASAAA